MNRRENFGKTRGVEGHLTSEMREEHVPEVVAFSQSGSLFLGELSPSHPILPIHDINWPSNTIINRLDEFIIYSIPDWGDAECISIRRNDLKKVGILVIALALLIAGIAMADPGITATKQISFIGENGAGITSTDNILTSGCGPGFCNTVEAGSSITMSVVNTVTTTNSRFVRGSVTTPVTVNHNIRVDALGATPSQGKVSAFMKGSTQEARGTTSNLFEQVEFSESTSMDGQITLFDKQMHWESGIGRA
jgi:hypothetical protein